jgi:hypothetical protein
MTKHQSISSLWIVAFFVLAIMAVQSCNHVATAGPTTRPIRTVVVDDTTDTRWTTEHGGRYWADGREQSFLTGGYNAAPTWQTFDRDKAKAFGAAHRGVVVLDVFDNAYFGALTQGQLDDEEHAKRMGVLIDLVRTIRSGNPGLRISIYNIVANYWAARDSVEAPWNPRVTSWRKSNDRLLPLIRELDFVCVAGYVEYQNFPVWADVNAITGHIAEGRRLARYVAVYTSVDLSGSSAFGRVPFDRLRPALAAASYADAVVLWGDDGRVDLYERTALMVLSVEAGK